MRIMRRLVADIAPGSTMTQNVFMMPRFLNTIYVGIMPPEKNMVNIMKNVTVVRPYISRRDRL